MGYYTNYELEVDQEVLGDLDTEMKSATEYEGWHEGKLYSVKWYSHEDDMRLLSAKYKGVLFTLRGEGEGSGDIWVKYFRDGKMQEARAKIVYDPFDPSKLE